MLLWDDSLYLSQLKIQIPQEEILIAHLSPVSTPWSGEESCDEQLHQKTMEWGRAAPQKYVCMWGVVRVGSSGCYQKGRGDAQTHVMVSKAPEPLRNNCKRQQHQVPPKGSQGTTGEFQELWERAVLKADTQCLVYTIEDTANFSSTSYESCK